MNIFAKWAHELTVVVCIVLVLGGGYFVVRFERDFNTTYDVGQMIQLKLGGTGMITGRGMLGYRVRVGHKEIWYKEFELEEL